MYYQSFFDENLKIVNHKYDNIDLNDKNELDNLIFKTKTNLEDLWKNNNLINTSLKLPINLQLNPKETLNVLNLKMKWIKLT